MLLMLLIGWTILLPAVVVAGLYLGSSVLGRRRAHGPRGLPVWHELSRELSMVLEETESARQWAERTGAPAPGAVAAAPADAPQPANAGY